MMRIKKTKTTTEEKTRGIRDLLFKMLLSAVIGGILGLYGMVLGFLVLVVNLCSLHTLGTPLTAPIAPWQPRTLRELFWRSGWQRLGQEDYNVSSARQRERGQTDDQDA